MMADVRSMGSSGTLTSAPPPPPAGAGRTRHARELWARAARRDLARLRDPRRRAAILIVGLVGGLIVAWLQARGTLVGADARAYWAAARIWLAGGNPYDPGGAFLPYAYAPWLLPLFLPWALLPWNVAWAVWQGSMAVLLSWSFSWAYRRHPLATALLIAALALPLAATLDTGNVTLFLALAVWAAQFTGPVVGGALWALATGMKWFPAILIGMLPPRARLWGIAFLALAAVLSLAMWQETLIQLDIVLNFPRPLRLDYLLILWAMVPWLWRHPQPLWWLKPAHVAGLAETALRGSTAWFRELRRSPGAAAGHGRRATGGALRSFFGLTGSSKLGQAHGSTRGERTGR
jgi:hypothetical protein